jgi:RNA polymerase sigma factor (sigma-70 family)
VVGTADKTAGNSSSMGDSGGEQLSDAELITRSLRDPICFAGLFDRHARTVHRYLGSRVVSSDVDDLVSETFIAAFRGRARYDSAYGDARPWLLGIATNILRHHRRAEGRRFARLRRLDRDQPTDPTEGWATDLAYAAQSDRVGRALSALDERYRDVLLLVAGPGLSYEEVARALRIPVGTVRSRVSRGRAQLRELLGLSGKYADEVTAQRTATEGLLE